jgi:hypothetical protein
MSYINKDGLVIFFPSDNRSAKGTYSFGETPSAGEWRVEEFLVDLTKQTSTLTALNFGFAPLARNSRIEEVDVSAEVAAVGGTSVTIGTVDLTGATVAAAGLVSAMPIASIDTLGERNVLIVGSTSAGTLIGTTLVKPQYVAVNVAGTFSAGLLRVRVKLYVPTTDPYNSTNGF